MVIGVVALGLIIGVVAGLRSMTAPALVSVGAFLDWLDVQDTWASWMAHPITMVVLVLLAVGEMAIDKSSSTPSRKSLPAFGSRMVTGAFSAVVLATGAGAGAAVAFVALAAGLVGAVLGTLAGHRARTRITEAWGRDRPVALIEDGVAVVAACATVYLAGLV